MHSTTRSQPKMFSVTHFLVASAAVIPGTPPQGNQSLEASHTNSTRVKETAAATIIIMATISCNCGQVQLQFPSSMPRTSASCCCCRDCLKRHKLLEEQDGKVIYESPADKADSDLYVGKHGKQYGGHGTRPGRKSVKV
jgi:hypothetical protein